MQTMTKWQRQQQRSPSVGSGRQSDGQADRWRDIQTESETDKVQKWKNKSRHLELSPLLDSFIHWPNRNEVGAAALPYFCFSRLVFNFICTRSTLNTLCIRAAIPSDLTKTKTNRGCKIVSHGSSRPGPRPGPVKDSVCVD